MAHRLTHRAPGSPTYKSLVGSGFFLVASLEECLCFEVHSAIQLEAMLKDSGEPVLLLSLSLENSIACAKFSWFSFAISTIKNQSVLSLAGDALNN